jgi:hypothetical protein
MKQFDVKNWRNKFIFESKFDLPGDQEKIDVAKPKGQITKADFDKLRKDKETNEVEDHEVSMANNSLEAIVKAAMELKAKMGDQEKDIPAWIQDHITNAANFIRQASENYHEYGAEEQDIEGEDNSSMMESDGYTIEDFLSVLKNYPNVSSKEQVVTAYNKLDAADQPEALKKASGKDVLPMPAKEKPKRF